MEGGDVPAAMSTAQRPVPNPDEWTALRRISPIDHPVRHLHLLSPPPQGGGGGGDESSYGLLDINQLVADSTQLFAGDPDTTLNRLAREMVAESRPVTSAGSGTAGTASVFDGSALSGDETVDGLSGSAVVSETHAIVRALSNTSMESVEPSVASLISALSYPSHVSAASDLSGQSLFEAVEESPLPVDWSKDVQRIASSLTGLDHYLSTSQTPASAGAAYMSAPAAVLSTSSLFDHGLHSVAGPPLPDVAANLRLAQVRMVPGQEEESVTAATPRYSAQLDRQTMDLHGTDGRRFPLPGQEHSPDGSVSEEAGNRALGEGEDSEGDQASLFRNYLNPSDASLLLAQYIASQQHQTFGQSDSHLGGDGDQADSDGSVTSSPRYGHSRDSRQPLSSPLGSSHAGAAGFLGSDGSVGAAGGDNATPVHVSSHSLGGVSDIMDDHQSDVDAQCAVPRTEGVGSSPNQSDPDLGSSMDADTMEAAAPESHSNNVSAEPWLDSLRQGPSGQPYDRPDVLGEVNALVSSSFSHSTVHAHHYQPVSSETVTAVSISSTMPFADTSRSIQLKDSIVPDVSLSTSGALTAESPVPDSSIAGNVHPPAVQSSNSLQAHSDAVALLGSDGQSLPARSLFDGSGAGSFGSDPFGDMLQGDGSFYSQLGFRDGVQLDEDFVSAGSGVGDMLDAHQDENAEEYQFDPAFVTSFSDKSGQEDFSHNPLPETLGEVAHTVGTPKSQDASSGGSGHAVAAISPTQPLSTPQKIPSSPAVCAGATAKGVTSALDVLAASDHSLDDSSFRSEPSPSAYFAARSSVLGGLDDLSGIRSDQRPHFALGHPLFSPPSALGCGVTSALGHNSFLADSAPMLSTSATKSVPGNHTTMESSQPASMLSFSPASPAKAVTDLYGSRLLQGHQSSLSVDGTQMTASFSYAMSDAQAVTQLHTNRPSQSINSEPAKPRWALAGAGGNNSVMNQLTTATGLPTASAIFLSPTEVLRQSYTLGQFVDTMAVDGEDGSLLSHLSSRDQPVAATPGAQPAFPSAYLDGDSLLYSRRGSSTSSYGSTPASDCSSLPGEQYFPDHHHQHQGNDVALSDSDTGTTSDSGDETAHAMSATGVDGVGDMDSTPVPLTQASRLQYGAVRDMDQTPVHHSVIDNHSGVLSLEITPAVYSENKQGASVVLRSEHRNSGASTALPTGGISHIEVAGLNFEKKSAVTPVHADLDMGNLIKASVQNEVSAVKVDVTAPSHFDVTHFLDMSIPNDAPACMSVSPLAGAVSTSAVTTAVPSSTVPSTGTAAGSPMQSTSKRSLFEAGTAPSPSEPSGSLAALHSPRAGQHASGTSPKLAATSQLQDVSPLPSPLRRIVQPKNIEKWLADLLQNSPRSNSGAVDGVSPQHSPSASYHGSNGQSPQLSSRNSEDHSAAANSGGVALSSPRSASTSSKVAKSLSESFDQLMTDSQLLGPVVLLETFAIRGIQCVGVPVPFSLPVRNSGTKWIKATLQLTMSDDSPLRPEMASLFQVNPRITLGPLKSTDLQMTCLPHAAGSFSAKLVMSSLPVLADELSGRDPTPVVNSCVLNVNAIEAQLHVVQPPINSMPASSSGRSASIMQSLTEATATVGPVMSGATSYYPMCLRNPCSISLPIRLMIATDQLSFGTFSFASSPTTLPMDANQLASTLVLSPPSPLPSLTTVACGTIPPCQAGQYHIAWVAFKAPVLPAVEASTPLAEYGCSIQTELDVTSNFPLTSVRVAASVGMARLHAPQSIQAMSFSSMPDKPVQRSVPLRNAGNLPCKVELSLSPPSTLFDVQPSSVILQPNQEVTVNVTFLCSIAQHTVSSYLVMSIADSDNQYELLLRGTSFAHSHKPADDSAPSAVDVAASRSFLCCNCNQVTFSSIPLKTTRTESFLLCNTSHTEDVLLELSIPQHDDVFKISLPPHKCILSPSTSTGSKSKLPSAKLGPQEKITVTVHYTAERLAAVKSSCLIRDLKHAMKFQIPLFAYGGKAAVAALTGVHNTPLTKIRLGQLAQQRSISKLVVENRGNRDGFVKILCYEDEACSTLIPAECMAVSPVDSTIPAGKSKKFLLIVNPLACQKHPVVGHREGKRLATLCLFSGDELARCRWRKICRTVGEPSSATSSPRQDASLTSLNRDQPVCTTLSRAGLNRPMTGENLELKELSCYAAVGAAAEEQELFESGVQRQEVHIIASLPALRSDGKGKTPPRSSKQVTATSIAGVRAPVASDVMAVLDGVGAASAGAAEPTQHTSHAKDRSTDLESDFNFQQFPPGPAEATSGKGRNTTKAAAPAAHAESSSRHMTDADWLVSPTLLSLNASSKEGITGTVKIKNLSSRACRFGVHWPGYLLKVSPDYGFVPARGTVSVAVSLKLSANISYPPSTTLTFTCGSTRKDVIANIRPAPEPASSSPKPKLPASARPPPSPPRVSGASHKKFARPNGHGKAGATRPPAAAAAAAASASSQRTITFPPIAVGQTAESGISLNNVTSSVMKWQLVSLRPAYVMPVGSSSFESQTLYSAFVADSRSGSLDPLEKREVYVTFEPRDVGTFSQLWQVEYTLPGHHSSASGVAKKRKQQLLFSAKALPQVPLSTDSVHTGVDDSSADNMLAESQPLIGPLGDLTDSAVPTTRLLGKQQAAPSRRSASIAELITAQSSSLQFASQPPNVSSMLKVSISNRAHQSVEMDVMAVDQPFGVRSSHHHFTLRARSCVRLPVRYEPAAAGRHRGVLVLSLPAHSHQLSVQLCGQCSPS